MIGTPDALFTRIQHDISRQGFTEVTFPLSEQQLQEAERRYLRFLTLDAAEKGKFEVWIPGLHRNNPSQGTRFGYKDEDRERGQGDNKEYFHHGKYLRRNLASIIAASPQEARDFIEAADEVLNGVDTSMRPVYEALETTVPGFEALFKDTPYTFLRFLAYKRPFTTADGLAIPHFDRGALTEAIYENRPGLCIYPATDEDINGATPEETRTKRADLLERLRQHPVAHTPGTAFVFASDAISSVLPQEYLSQFPKGYHVVNEDHLGQGEGQSYSRRTAIVAFISPKTGVSIGDWNSRHPHGGVDGYQ